MKSPLVALALGVALLSAIAATAETVDGPRPFVAGHPFEPGPIVNGHHRQPTRGEIEARMREAAARTLWTSRPFASTASLERNCSVKARLAFTSDTWRTSHQVRQVPLSDVSFLIQSPCRQRRAMSAGR